MHLDAAQRRERTHRDVPGYGSRSLAVPTIPQHLSAAHAAAAPRRRQLSRPARAAGARRVPKPPLTEAHLNAFITVLRKSVQPDSEALKTQASRDWRALLQAQFTLTPVQQRTLEDLPKETVDHVQAAIRDALHANTAFIVRVVAATDADPPVPRPSEGTSGPASRTGARVAPQMPPDAVRCTRDNEAYTCRVHAGVGC